jgi:hypothetical protein
MRAAFLALACLAGGCASSLVPLLDNGGVPVTLTPPRDVPLEVITHKNSSVADPLPVRGARIAFGDVEVSLGHAIASATVPWAEAHRAQRPDGWQLQVDLVQADASTRGDAITVVLGVRATLRTRVGNRYIAQTQAHCKRTASVDPKGAAPVVFDCMARVGRELGGWLGSPVIGEAL